MVLDRGGPPRLLVKVARLYHTRGLRQSEIAERLRISQARVSRLLQQAESLGIVQTVVVLPPGLNSDLEEAVETCYGVKECHVIDAVADSEEELAQDLGQAMASIMGDAGILTSPRSVVGYNSWSRTLQAMVAALQPIRGGAGRVVEMLGDIGPPALQHEAARSTQRLAALTDAEPVYLRTPGVSSTAEIRAAILEQDRHARETLHLLDRMDVALVGVGECDVVAPLRAGDNFFTQEQFDRARQLGAVGQICLRFLDQDGGEVVTEYDDLVIGVTLAQLRAARLRCAAAGGPSKYAVIRAALLGGWLDTLVLDVETAEYLVGPGKPGG
jgi:DNA-binding transcriptional regulator LsrR (DeoR family)